MTYSNLEPKVNYINLDYKRKLYYVQLKKSN